MIDSVIDTLDTVQVVLIILKVFDIIATPWLILFVPAYIMFVLSVIVPAIRRSWTRSRENEDTPDQEARTE